METVFGVLLHRDMWRREGDGVWPLRNVSAARGRVDTRRLHAGSPRLYAQATWKAELIDFVSLTTASGATANGYLCRLTRGAS